MLIAVGSAANVPADVPGHELGITSDGFFELTELPKKYASVLSCLRDTEFCRAAVVGGGYIAVELSSILNGLGCDTSLVVRSDKILKQVSIVSTVARLLAAITHNSLTHDDAKV